MTIRNISCESLHHSEESKAYSICCLISWRICIFLSRNLFLERNLIIHKYMQSQDKIQKNSFIFCKKPIYIEQIQGMYEVQLIWAGMYLMLIRVVHQVKTIYNIYHLDKFGMGQRVFHELRQYLYMKMIFIIWNVVKPHHESWKNHKNISYWIHSILYYHSHLISTIV